MRINFTKVPEVDGLDHPPRLDGLDHHGAQRCVIHLGANSDHLG
jgi:hypothetical protein